MNAETSNHDRVYVMIWGMLLVALLGSLALGALTTSSVAVAIIFVVAAVKAWWVVGYFMHLHREPRFLKLTMLGTVAAVAALLVGVFPDVAGRWAVIPPEAVAASAVQAADTGAPGDPTRGHKVFTTFCAACHMADGRGNGGTTAADFVGDPSRLGKTDEQLLRAIEDGVTGKIGAMPAWKASLTPQQRRDALAYIRDTFGNPAGKAH